MCVESREEKGQKRESHAALEFTVQLRMTVNF